MVPSLYNRYYDDTLARMPSTIAAADFLITLNGLHLSLRFTMELPADNMIPSIGIEILRMEHNLTPVFTESQPTLVYSCIFIAMKSNPVTKLQTQFIEDHVTSRLCPVIYDRSLQ